MKKSSIRIFTVLSASLFMQPMAFAQTASSSLPTNAGVGSAAPTYGLPTSTPLPSTPSNSIQQQAQSAQNANNSESQMAQMAGMVSAVIAATNASPCFSTPPNMGACTMMAAGIAGVAISMGISMEAQKAASGAGDTAGQVTQATPPSESLVNAGAVPNSVTNPDLVKALDTLASKGVTYNPSTNSFSLPNGSSVSGSDLAAGNMGGMGLSPSDQAAAKNALAGIMKDAQSQILAKGKTDDFSSGDLMGGGGSGASSSDPAATTADAVKKADARKPASVSGLKKVVDNGRDAIGVASDNLWTMIANRYKVKGDQGSFVTK